MRKAICSHVLCSHHVQTPTTGRTEHVCTLSELEKSSSLSYMWVQATRRLAFVTKSDDDDSVSHMTKGITPRSVFTLDVS